MNRHVGVVNLSTDTRRAVVYACAHTAVLFDMDENSQRLLRGHVSISYIKGAQVSVIFIIIG